MFRDVRMEASLRPKPSLDFRVYRRCEPCARDGVIVPNPEGLDFCPRCTARFSTFEEGNAESTAIHVPLLARLYYWLSDWLIALHDWLTK